MIESGPVKKTCKDLKSISELGEFQYVAPGLWRATSDGKYWMVKTSRDTSCSGAELLRREWEIACNLQHPFIASTLRFDWDTPKGPAIIIEYVEGRTLREFIAEKPSLTARLKVFDQILDAVEYLHFKGLLHNDIKLDNIMVTAVGNDVKIIDFGLAESAADYLNRRLGGTRGSSAPEVLDGDDTYASTAASDIYSLGGVLGFLLPGRYHSVVKKCHRANPEKRYRDISSLRRAILRRNRLPRVIAVSLILSLTAAVAVIPDMVERKMVRQREEAFQAAISKIQSDMNGFYRETADSLKDRSSVPYSEFASDVQMTFGNRTFEYRSDSVVQEMLPVYDSIYARCFEDLQMIISEIPSYHYLHESGLISDEERKWCDYLTLNRLRYRPKSE